MTSTAIPWTAPFVVGSFATYLATAVVGGTFSLPEYRRLMAMADERPSHDPALHRRLRIAAWVNRVELFVVYIAVVATVMHVSLGRY